MESQRWPVSVVVPTHGRPKLLRSAFEGPVDVVAREPEPVPV